MNKSIKHNHNVTLKSSNLYQKIKLKIAHEFNPFFTNVEKNLASKISGASTRFQYLVNKSDFVMETKVLSMNELEDAFCSLKRNKSPNYI